jgi:NAD-dependent dihydropyrimidine dehydrogenase PreA subunit
MTYVIALPCVDLLDKTCIDECPVDCIYEGERMLVNVEFFQNLGSPGGASRVGKIHLDHPLVASLPPQR